MLDAELIARDKEDEISYEKPDPLLVAKKQQCDYAVLICAMFSYGNAALIVKFLDSLDFSLLSCDEQTIKQSLKNHYYRFQNSTDVAAIFIALKRLKQKYSLEEIIYEGYKENGSVLDGIDRLIKLIKQHYEHSSMGYDFLISKPLSRDKNGFFKNSNAPYKRYNMFLRWMVRDGNLDLKRWSKIGKKDLLLPLDTHTFNVSKRLGLLKSGGYNLGSAINITNQLKEFDKNDPIKYDFAIYRLGQEKLF